MLAKKILSRILFFRHWPKKFILIAILIIVASLWFLYSRVAGGKEQVNFAPAKKQDVRSTVSSSGTLEGRNTANLRFSGGGKLAYVNVKAGDIVTKDQALAGLDVSQLAISLQQAENTLKEKQAALQKVIDDIHLFQYGNGGFSNVGTANETQTQRSTRMAAEAAANNANDAVRAARRAFVDNVLNSPMDGMITQVNFIEGQNVGPTDTIIQVVDDSEIYFDAEVDESDIAQVSINQKAEVSLNSYPDRVFKGFVSEIIPHTKTTSSGATVVVVRINLGQPGIKFIADTNGQADIITEEKFSVLTIPQEALVSDKEVYVKEGNGYKKVNVETGIQTDTEVEIKSGLAENQEVVINPSVVEKK